MIHNDQKYSFDLIKKIYSIALEKNLFLFTHILETTE